MDFLRGFGKTLKFKPFLKLCAATFLVFNGFILIASFQSYVIIYYVFGGDAAGGGVRRSLGPATGGLPRWRRSYS